MTSATIRNFRRYDPLQPPKPYGSYYTEEGFWDRLNQPSVLLPVVVVIGTVCYQFGQNFAASHGRRIPPFGELLWNSIVYISPAFLLYAIDRWVNPPLFPAPMLQAQSTTYAAKSDVLRRILRFDQPGSIVASVTQAGRRTLSNAANLTFKGDPSQPAGLGNWDNSCYQNSILQGLASLKPIPRYLGGLLLGTPSAQRNADTAMALRELIDELNDASNNSRTLWTPNILKNMSTSQQQDAQEYFSKLLDEIDKEMAKAAKSTLRPSGFETDPSKDDTVSSQHSDDSGYQSLSTISKGGSELKMVRSPLEGSLAQRVACTACGFSEGLSLIPFNCLTLNFEVEVPQYDLYELLDNYVRLESIQNVECTKCTLLKYRKGLQALVKMVPDALPRLEAVETAIEEEDFDEQTLKNCKLPKTKVESTKTKQAVIARPPQSLVIHMNRSVFDETTFRTFKNMAAVQFPSMLDLGPWTLGSAAGGNPGVAVKDDGDDRITQVDPDEEKWGCGPTSSMVAGDLHPSKVTGPFYELRAVVTHYGRHENGHYVCYRKHPRASTVSESGESKETADQLPLLVGDHSGDDADSGDDDTLVDKDISEAQEIHGVPTHDQIRSQEPESQWWRLSDQDVVKVSEDFVLAQGGVFMLFYDCVDPNAVLVSQVQASKADSFASAHDFLETACTKDDSATPEVSGSETEQPEALTESLKLVDDGHQSALLRDTDSIAESHDTPVSTIGPQLHENRREDEILVRARAVPLPDEESADGI